MSDFLAAALQLTSTSDIDANLNVAEEQIELASRRGADLVGLPENFAFLGEDQKKLKIASSIYEKCNSFLVTMARRYQVVLLGGGFPVPAGDGERTLNRAELFGKDGQSLARYDKIHLFDVDLPEGNTYRESETIVSGSDSPPVVDVPGLCKIGLSICYDVRFPELYRDLADKGADLLMIPAAFTAFTGKDHGKCYFKQELLKILPMLLLQLKQAYIMEDAKVMDMRWLLIHGARSWQMQE